MAYDKQALIDQLGGLTVLELVDLVEGLKENVGRRSRRRDAPPE